MTYRKLAAGDTGQLYTGHYTKMTPLSFEELPCIMNPETEKTYSIPEINARFSINMDSQAEQSSPVFLYRHKFITDSIMLYTLIRNNHS